MRPRPATPADGLCWITGAGSGIGAATALELAGRGWRVAISARRRETLEAVAALAPASIIVAPCDVTDAEAVATTLSTLEAEHGPVARAFLNAGISVHGTAQQLDVAAVRRIIDTNVMGAFHALAPLLPRMAARGKGQIAICASIAGYGGLPGASAYTASKAAMINAATALAIEGRALGILVQCVNPGFVDTPLTRKNSFPMPFLMTPEAAARRIADGLEKSRFEIAFPRRLAWSMKALHLLPQDWYIRLVGFGERFR